MQLLSLGKVEDLHDNLISPTLYQYVRRHLDKQVQGVFKAKYGRPDYDLMTTMRKNASRFSAHKAAYFTEWMRDKSKEERQAIRRLFLNQLNTEQNLAARASRAAKQWHTLLKDSDQYPNLQYLPSRSVNKRKSHTRYYGMILPIGYSFWNNGLPPNDWNCKCRVRATDKPPTKALTPPKPVKGIPGNAGKEKAIFTEQHPFFKNVKNKNALQKAWMKLERKTIRKWTQANIEGKAFNSSQGNILVNGTGVKKIIRQEHEFEWEKNMLLYEIETVIKQAEFIKQTPFIKSKKGEASFESVLYFKILLQEKDSYLVLRKQIDELGGNLVLYDIKDKIK